MTRKKKQQESTRQAHPYSRNFYPSRNHTENTWAYSLHAFTLRLRHALGHVNWARLGHFSLQRNVGELSNKSSEVEVNRRTQDLGVASPSSDDDPFYMDFRLNFSSLKAIIAAKSDSWFTPEAHAQPSMQFVDEFDMSFVLKLCKDHRIALPRIRISGDLPELTMHITPLKYLRFSSILRVFTGKTSKPLATDAASPSVFDDDHVSRPGSDQRMEFFLSIPRLCLEAARFENHSPFAKVLLSGLFAHFQQNLRDTRIGCSLRSLTVEDCTRFWSPATKFLIRSLVKDVEDSSSDESKQDLIDFTWLSVSESSPKYSDVENMINVAFNQLDVHVHQETLVILIELLSQCFPSRDGDISAETDTSETLLPKVSDSSQASEMPTSLKLQGKLQQLYLSLYRGDEPLAEVTLGGLDSVLTQRRASLGILGTIHIIRLRDVTPEGLLHCRVLEPRSGVFPVSDRPMVDFSYQTGASSEATFVCGITSMQIVCLGRFIDELKLFRSEVISSLDSEAALRTQQVEADTVTNIRQRTKRNGDRVIPVHNLEYLIKVQ